MRPGRWGAVRAGVCTSYRANMTERMLGFVFICLSAALLCSVSAGGRYCANSAAARAAALGLDYPGAHGAPDLSGSPHYSALHPGALHHQLFQKNPQPPAMHYNMLHNLPKEFPRFHLAEYGSPVQTNPLRGFYGREPLNNRQANFEQVKRVVSPRMQTLSSGQADFEYGASESHRNKLGFALNRRSPTVDVAAPNRHGVSGMSGRSLPFSPGFHFMPYPIGEGSKHGIANTAMGPRRSWQHGYSAWPMYGRVNNKPRNPFKS